MVRVLLIACALMTAQPGDRADWHLAPKLDPGLELVYVGSYLEESLIPNVQYQRQYRLETHALVLEARAQAWDLAVMTALRSQGAGAPDKAEAPHSVRLELVKLDAQGKLRAPAGTPLGVPLLGPPTLELGFVVDVPVGRVRRLDLWEVAPEGRPPQGWQLVGTEACNGITCLKVVGQQESDNWKHPRADQVAWRRHDTIWLSPQHFVAQKVERVIERRDPARQQPTQRATVRYELESRLRYPGKLFEDRKVEIARLRQFQDEAQPWLQDAIPHKAPIENMLKRVAQYVEQQPPTPYRKAFAPLKANLEAARNGESIVQAQAEDPTPAIRAVAVGQRVPDFVASSLTERESTRLNRCLGRPVLVVFYNPQTAMGRDVLLFAKGLTEAHAGKLSVLALAVTQDPDAARKQHADLRLPFPVLDGQGMRQTFGVDATPRIVLLDREGVVRTAQTGWGYETGAEVTETLLRCFGKQ